MIFTDDELAAYPGTSASVSAETVALLRDLAAARIYKLLPPEIADNDDTAKGIALEVVARATRNSNGYAAENVDDYAYRRDSATSAAGIYLTKDERAELLELNPGAPRSRTRSVRLRSWSVPEL